MTQDNVASEIQDLNRYIWLIHLENRKKLNNYFDIRRKYIVTSNIDVMVH